MIITFNVVVARLHLVFMDLTKRMLLFENGRFDKQIIQTTLKVLVSNELVIEILQSKVDMEGFSWNKNKNIYSAWYTIIYFLESEEPVAENRSFCTTTISRSIRLIVLIWYIKNTLQEKNPSFEVASVEGVGVL